MPLDSAFDIGPDLGKTLAIPPANTSLGAALSGSNPVAGAIKEGLPGALKQSLAGAAEQKAATEQGVKDLEAERAKFANMTAPVPPMPQRPPEVPHTDPVGAWGSLAMAAAMIGSAFTRQPMVHALNAAAGVMNAYRKGDMDAYKIAFDRWKAESDYGAKVYEYQHNAYRDAIEMIKNEATIAKGMADLRVQAAAFNDGPMKSFAEAGKAAEVISLDEQRQQAHDKAAAELPAVQALGEARGEALQAIKDRDAARKAGNVAGEAVANQELQVAEQKVKVLQEKPGTGGWVILNDPTKKDAQGNPAQYRFNTNTSEATTLTGEPFTPGGAEKVGAPSNPRSAQVLDENDYIKHHPGATRQEAHRAYRRDAAIESAFAGGVVGRNLISLNTVASHIELLKEYGEALKNNNIPAVNQLLNRMSVQEGMPEVIQFALARTITGDEVVRLLTTTGGTVEDRQGLQKLFSEYGSPAQIEGAIDVASRFVGERLGPLEQQYARNDPILRKEFEEEMLTPAARNFYMKGKAGAAATPSGNTGVPTITNQEAYDALPNGAEYLGPDGTRHIKGQR